MKNPSRKYVDLIHAASSKWGNWDPPKTILVGDYGTINKKTGQFEREGNIYEDPDIALVSAKHPPQTAAPENSWVVTSGGVKSHDFALEPGVNIAGIVNAAIKGQWEFGTKCGALLIMARPRSSYIPRNVLLEQLVKFPVLKDKSLVTEAISCPAYSLYLSSTQNDIISVALLGTLPVTPGISAGGGARATWWKQNITGTFREACDDNGSHVYTTLFALKKIRRKGLLRRDSPHPEPEGDDLWVDTQEPWDVLDEDGEEVLSEDTVFD